MGIMQPCTERGDPARDWSPEFSSQYPLSRDVRRQASGQAWSQKSGTNLVEGLPQGRTDGQLAETPG